MGTAQGMRIPFLFDLLVICFPSVLPPNCCLTLMLLTETTRSSLARGISNANLAESLMAFNTNYRDTGIFGIYTVAPVSLLLNLLSLF